MRGGPLDDDVHRALVRARGLDGNLDGPGVTVVVLAVVAPLVASALGLPAAINLALLGASIGAVGWLALFRARRIAARVARVLDAVRDRPEVVAEIAHRGALIELFIAGGDGAAFLVPAARAAGIVEALTARCPHARVHAGRPSPKIRAAPVARLLDRT